MNISYSILKHVMWRFQIYNLFLEIFKFREDKSNNVFREILKCFRETAKLKFLAKYTAASFYSAKLCTRLSRSSEYIALRTSSDVELPNS